MKKGFTLIELIVVIAIVGILMAALVVYLLGSTESARNAQCMSNMKQLAQAVHSYARDTHWYPTAGSVERMHVKGLSSKDGIKATYDEFKGWISWNSQKVYSSSPKSHVANVGWFISAYNQDDNVREYCITNGALWRYVNKARKCYTCPNHLRKMPSAQKPNWSYVMNSSFGWDYTIGEDAMSDDYRGVYEFIALGNRAKKLLFAELQWEDSQWDATLKGIEPKYSSSSGIENDCTLQYGDDDGGEFIGFNHKVNNHVCAHVVFADGHTDKILFPKKGSNKEDLKKLTEFLCEGKEFYFDGSSWKKAKGVD